MRVLTFFSLFAFWGLPVWGQYLDTLRTMPAGQILTTYPRHDEIAGSSPPMYEWGYKTGHNIYIDQAFAEKYEITGTGRVLGVVAYLTGKKGNTPNQVDFQASDVGANRMPANVLGTQTVFIRDLDLTGSANTIYFTSPAAVADSFFVLLNLGPYDNISLGGDTIALLAGYDGQRPVGDRSVRGRNAVRWHSHTLPVWKDFLTQNYTPISTYLALFPIVDFAQPQATATLIGRGLQLKAPYPMPAGHVLNVPYAVAQTGVVSLELRSSKGELVQWIPKQMQVAGDHLATFSTVGLAAGAYTLILQTQAGALACRVQVQ